MVSTFTPNINLEEPARGDYVGTWDTPVNSNMTVVDKVVGGISGIALNNSPVVLSAAQFQSHSITFTSTLTGSVAITFPTSFVKTYYVVNACTGTSAFVVTLQTTVAGGQVVGCPPGDVVSVGNDGQSMYYINLGRVGSYMDYAGSSVPSWVTACTKPPYLNCDATTFSSATYPHLTTILGGTTLPDRRGTAGYALNQGTGRLTAASGGLDGNTIRATKVTDSVTLGTSNLPPYTPSGGVTAQSTSSFIVQYTDTFDSASVAGGGQAVFRTIAAVSQVRVNSTGVLVGTAQGGVSDPVAAIGTGTVYGICMIRAA